MRLVAGVANAGSTIVAREGFGLVVGVEHGPGIDEAHPGAVLVGLVDAVRIVKARLKVLEGAELAVGAPLLAMGDGVARNGTPAVSSRDLLCGRRRRAPS